MPEVTTQVKGLKELKANLQKLGADVAKGVMTEGLEAGGKVLVTALGERTPVDEGTLREHLIMATEIASSGTAGRVRVGFGKQGYKARFIEFGHRLMSHGPKSERKVIGHVPANSFMRQAFDASKTEARNAVIEVIRKKVNSK